MNPSHSAGRPAIVLASRRVPDYAGGLAAYQRELARRLSARGWDVRLAAWMPSGQTQPGLLEGEAELPEPGFAPPERLWMRMASRPAWHGLLEWWIARLAPRAFPGLWKRGSDVVHFIGTGWDFAGFAAAACARRRHSRLTVWPAVHPGSWGDDVVDVRFYRRADAVFCQSHHELQHLKGLGVAGERMRVCGLPPMCRSDGDGAKLRRELGLGSRPTVLFMGRRDAGKGFPALIEAWPLVLADFPDAALLVAGPSAEGTASAASGFIDLGVADPVLQAEAFAACDIFCLPSAHESFGIVYAEAWSYGKPVVCGTAPASREWIEDGVLGLWTDGSAPSIARQLSRLLGDAELRRRIGGAGLQFQKEHLTWDRLLGAHEEAFGLPGRGPT
ncbi:MAG: glycosyltransferase family 4 protein [Terrimicrobiaceae bacterium]|nr:glycosyltransferase family 4 protein [Terrimicrobiaceae bacterium]